MLFIDDRPRGKHGIGRFARETLSRLETPHRSLGARGNPARPWDAVSPARLPLGAKDVVYTPGFNAGFTRARQIVTLHDLIHLQVPAEQSAAKTAFYEHVVKPAMIRAGVAVTVSPTSAREIAGWLGSAAADVELVDVGNGCADIFFEPQPPVDRDPSRLLWVGSLKPHKVPERAFDVLAAMPEATLTLVTNEIETATTLIENTGTVGRVRMVPDCPDELLRELYRTHGCLIFPSTVEGFGLPVVEATAVGCPVVYLRSCESVREILRDVGTAVDGVATDDWVEAIRTAAASTIRTPDDWIDRYSWAAVSTRLDAVLSRTAA